MSSYWWNHLINPIKVTIAPIAPVSGHGLLFTIWNGWFSHQRSVCIPSPETGVTCPVCIILTKICWLFNEACFNCSGSIDPSNERDGTGQELETNLAIASLTVTSRYSCRKANDKRQ